MDCSQEPLLGEHSSQENMQWQTEANIESQADSVAQPDELNEEDEETLFNASIAFPFTQSVGERAA